MNAQDFLTGLSAKWDDSFVEWTIYTDDEDTEGELKMRWLQLNDFSKWDYDLGDEYGRIDATWKNKFDEWTVFGTESTITMRPRFPGDLREWRITDNDITIYLRTRYNNRADEWVITDEKHGWFTIYTEYPNDPRDWIIVDELNEEITQTMKMAMSFIAVFNAMPKQ